MKLTKLGKLKVGDGFLYNKKAYIAFALAPDPFDVLCLNVETQTIEYLDESDMVERVAWEFIIGPERKRGKKLEVL